MISRNDVLSLQVGSLVSVTFDTVHGIPMHHARWTEPRKVVEIFARGVSVHGKAYACFYTEFGPNARMSGSIAEGDLGSRVTAAEVA